MVADEVVAQLGEADVNPKWQIVRAPRLLGGERVRAYVARAFEVEAAGGLLLADGSLRRTLGGVFFHLIRMDVGSKEFYRIVRPQTSGQGAAPQAGSTAAVAAPPLEWSSFGATAIEAVSAAGEATTIKLPVIGRPGTVVERSDMVFVAVRSEIAPSLPKGAPAVLAPVVIPGCFLCRMVTGASTGMHSLPCPPHERDL